MSPNDNQNGDKKYVELNFMTIILEFFNYHISLALRDSTSMKRIYWLVNNLLPSFKEMRVALNDFYVHEDVRL